MSLPTEMEALVTNVRPDGTFLDFSWKKKETPKIEKPTDIIIRMEATPVNPSDIGVVFGAANRFKAEQGGPNMISAPIPEKLRKSMTKTQYGDARVKDMVPGNEGAGVVVATGTDPKAQALIGKMVAVFGSGGCYAQFRKANGSSNAVMALPEGTTAEAAASSFVNPLTVLGFHHTMREEGHTALVQTASASQLGQQNLRVCIKDKVPIVNIVRKQEQVEVLKAIDPNAICVSSSLPSFMDDLANAMKKTGATLCFDATGGGSLSAQVLDAFDKAGQTRPGVQVYNYGGLDVSPSTCTEAQKKRCGFWLLPAWQPKHRDAWQEHMKRVAVEINTTFTTSYTASVGLQQAVTLDALNVYGKQETGKKYLLNPQKTATAKL